MTTAQAEISRFVQFYGSELQRTGFKPDASSTRETRIAFLQETVKRFCSPLLSMKRADAGRPISDEVVVFVQAGPSYRVFADFLISGGSSSWKLSDHLEGFLPVEQPLVNPLTLDRLPEHTLAPTVPGCSGPGPQPEPPPVGFPYPDENTTIRAYQERVRKAYSDAGRAFPSPNDSDAFRWFSRYGYSCSKMPEPQAADKHIAELRAELGV
jgi:hypothetical protein